MGDKTEKYILYIGGLSDEVDQKVLQAAFVPFGEVKSVDIPIDLTTQKHKGFGFVEYEEYEDCLQAIDNMNDAEIYGKVIRVSFAKAQKLKEGYHKPIWTEESYINANTINPSAIADQQIESNNKKVFE